MATAARNHHGIRGSAALGTTTALSDPAVLSAEALAPGELRRVAVRGEWLGAARIRARFAALPLDAFDRAGEVLAADEQGAYFQLLRLSFGDGRNFCRCAKKDLQRRLRLSERRLSRVIGALVARGFVRPLHRDNRGTLWRVYLPREAFGEPLGDDVLLGRASPAPPQAPEPAAGSRIVVLPARDATADPAMRVADLARQLAGPGGGPDALVAAEAQIAELLADGASPRQVAACVAAALQRSGRGAGA